MNFSISVFPDSLRAYYSAGIFVRPLVLGGTTRVEEDGDDRRLRISRYLPPH